MLKSLVARVLLTIVLLHGQSANAIRQSHGSQRVLEPKGRWPSESASTGGLVKPMTTATPYLGKRTTNPGTWIATCDSAEPDNPCKNAIDGTNDTFWSSGGIWPSQHWITINMTKTAKVNGIAMLPRQDDTLDGLIAGHNILLSEDGQKWTAVAYGTWFRERKSGQFFPRFHNAARC